MRLPYTFLHPYFFSLYFPEWSANCFERLLKKNTKRTPRGPIVLLSDTRGTPIVERCSLQLKTHGITEGTPLELAKILHPCLEIGRFQPKEDYEALKRLALWAVKFTPLVGIEQQHSGLILNITGTDRVHKGFQTLATRIFRALDGTGITTRIGGATTLGGAWALGRHGKHPITLSSPSMPRKERALFFAPLPLTALRISETTETQLAELGIYTIGDALKLPRKKLALRFGIRFIRALDQLLGDTPEPLLTVQTPEELCCEKEFDPPLLNRQHIVAEALSIFSAVLTRSQELHRKPFLFRFILSGMNLHYQSFVREHTLSLHTATHDTKTLESLLSPLIEKITFPGNVYSLTLMAQDGGTAVPLQEEQHALNPVSSLLAPEHTRQNLLNSLALQLGEKTIFTVVASNSHIPEKSFHYSPLPPHTVPTPARQSYREGGPQNASAIDLPFSANYPPVIFRKPEEITALALLPDHSPSRIQWRNQFFDVLTGIGPEHISEEWWHSHHTTETIRKREYFRIQEKNGRWFWIFRNSNMQWFIHGIWA